jgi:hypothetical protein
MRALRETASVFRVSWSDVVASTACLTEGEIAALAECPESQKHGRWLEHLAECTACRGRFAGLTRLLRDTSVAAELERLEAGHGAAPRRGPRRRHLTVAAALAAAALAGVLLRPDAAPPPSPLDAAATAAHRESAITTTIAPRILGPDGPAFVVDSLLWTRVPNAVRYRLRVFDTQGTLVWDAQTSDTTLPVPEHLRGDTANAYVWKVEARTGWDRWVASEWRDLVIRAEAHPR